MNYISHGHLKSIGVLDAVLGNYRRGNRRYFVIIRGYIDDSNTHGKATTTVASAVFGRVEDWEKLDSEWLKLNAPPLHAQHMKQKKNDFKGWSDEQIGDLQARAIGTISQSALFGMVAFINNVDFDVHYKEPKKPRKFPMSSKFGLCVWSIIDRMMPIIKNGAGDDVRIDFVVDRGPWFSGVEKLVQWLKENGEQQYAESLGTCTPGSSKEFPGLQVADMLASSGKIGEKLFRERLTTSAIQDHRDRLTTMYQVRHEFGARKINPEPGRFPRQPN